MGKRPSEKTRKVLIFVTLPLLAVGFIFALMANGNEALFVNPLENGLPYKFGLWKYCLNGICRDYQPGLFFSMLR